MTRYLEAAQRGRNAWWRYLLALAVACVLTIVLAVLVALGLDLVGLLPPALGAQIQSPTEPRIFFPAIGVIFGVILLGCWAGIRLVQGKRFQDVVGVWSWRSFASGAGVWLAILVLGSLLDFALAPDGFKLQAGPRTLELGLWALLGLGVQTFAEEWIFRGWVTQGLLLATRGALAASILSGLLFGALHIPNGLPQALGATVFGVAMSVIAIRLGGIAFTSGLHLANNMFGATILVSAQDVFRGAQGVFSFDAPQLMWLDLGFAAAALAGLAAYVGTDRRAVLARARPA